MQRSPNRTGPSKFPPNPKQWGAERNGLSIRDAFTKALHLPLEPFDIATRTPGVKLLTRPEVEAFLGEKTANILFNVRRDVWSGFGVPVEDIHLIVLNTTNPRTRQHATLAEELFHIRLRHKPCRMSRCPMSGLMKREYDPLIEFEAKHSAAAALVPYYTLREMLNSGATIESIAEFFHVSIALVEMRMKVTRLLRGSKSA